MAKAEAPDRRPAARHQVTVPAEESGARLDRVLAAALPSLSRSRLKVLIEDGQVSSGGQAVTSPSQRVQAGQVIAVEVPAAQDARPRLRP